MEEIKLGGNETQHKVRDKLIGTQHVQKALLMRRKYSSVLD